MLRKIRMYLKVAGLPGILAAAKAGATRSVVKVTLERRDLKHPIQLRIPSSDVPTYRQVFIDGEYAFHAQKTPEVIVDAGANIGLASVYFANKYPDAKIIAIEPEQSNFDLLKENTSPYPNIIPIQAALWNKNGEINLVDPGLGKWGFMTGEKTSSGESRDNVCHAVKAITVDRIIADYGLERVNILKVDIEGAEKEVFSDTSAWIDSVDSIIVELHERMKPGCNRSFYLGSGGFDHEWGQGENVYLSRRTFPITRLP